MYTLSLPVKKATAFDDVMPATLQEWERTKPRRRNSIMPDLRTGEELNSSFRILDDSEVTKVLTACKGAAKNRPRPQSPTAGPVTAANMIDDGTSANLYSTTAAKLKVEVGPPPSMTSAGSNFAAVNRNMNDRLRVSYADYRQQKNEFEAAMASLPGVEPLGKTPEEPASPPSDMAPLARVGRRLPNKRASNLGPLASQAQVQQQHQQLLLQLPNISCSSACTSPRGSRLLPSLDSPTSPAEGAQCSGSGALQDMMALTEQPSLVAAGRRGGQVRTGSGIYAAVGTRSSYEMHFNDNGSQLFDDEEADVSRSSNSLPLLSSKARLPLMTLSPASGEHQSLAGSRRSSLINGLGWPSGLTSGPYDSLTSELSGGEPTSPRSPSTPRRAPRRNNSVRDLFMHKNSSNNSLSAMMTSVNYGTPREGLKLGLDEITKPVRAPWSQESLSLVSRRNSTEQGHALGRH